MAVTPRQKSEVAGTGTSPTVAEPAGASNGDVLIALALCATSGAITNPAGWTSLYSGSQTSVIWRVAWIQRGGSAPSLTWGLNGSVYREVFIVCLQAAAAITLDSQSAAGTSGSAITSPNPPATVAVAATSLAVAGGLNFGESAGWTASTGYTLQQSNPGGGGNDGTIETKSLSAVGSEDPAVITSGGGTGDGWNGFTVTFTDASSGVFRSIDAHRPAPFAPSSATLRGF